MRSHRRFPILILVVAVALVGVGAGAQTYRTLLVGDSWTALMWSHLSLRGIFSTAGFPNEYEKGNVTAIGGTTASWWAQPANLQLITNELTNNPSIDMVHLSMGGNDFLAGQSSGGWYKGMGAVAEAALFDTIKSNIQTVVDHILDVDPTIHIVICSYDYINLWDTLNVQANQLLWANVGSPTPRELNEALIELGNHQLELGQEYGAAVTYVNNWGQMHLWYGYNSVFPPAQYPAPWGHPSYPVPKSALANNGDDAIHLDEDGYEIVALNCWNNFYQYFIDPNAGSLPPDVDTLPPPPPAHLQTVFYDGFENSGFTGANWLLSGTSYAYLNTLWGVVSLELDNSDTAIRAQNTSGWENVKLGFWKKTSGYDVWPADTFRVEYTTNYGASWNTLQSWTSNGDWSYHEYQLPSSCNNNSLFGVRFRSQTNSGSDNTWIDEVTIQATQIPCTLYDLTLQTDGVGSIGASPTADYGPTSYCSGTVVTLTANPGDGWTFVEWTGGASGSSNPINVTMNAAKTVKAVFVDSAGKPGLTQAQQNWTRWVSWKILDQTWPAATQDQIASLLYKANEAQTVFETYHMPYGQAANVWYSDYSRSQVDKYETIGDSAAMLGYYLGGLANKYAVTGDAGTLAQINDVLDTYDFLTQCSGKSGYIVRFAGLASDPAYQLYYQGYGNGYDTCVSPWSNYVWLDYSSRDTYIGTAFGLGNVWIHVSDSATRAKCQTITERVLDCLIADSWNIISPNSQFTNWTPGFLTIWQRLGITMNDPKYGSQYNYGTSFWLWHDTGGMAVGDKWNDNDYFADILATCSMYVVRSLETNVDKINALNGKFLTIAESGAGDHLNAHFAATYLGATGDYTRNVPRGVLQSCLIDYPSGEHWLREVDHSSNPLYPPKDAEHSLYALFVHDRVTSEWIWQIEPTRYAGGADVPIALMMIDKFVPYWMGRESGAIPAP